MGNPGEEPANAAWTRAELGGNPHDAADKPDRVRSMFSAIASRYDLNNRLHSFGRDQAWRRRAVALADVDSETDVLDVACGTGDLSLAFADAGVRSVTGVDFTPRMIELANVKKDRWCGARERSRVAANVTFEHGDAMNLRFEDASFDVVSIAFGIRNVADPHRALREFRRVLRPGGRLVVLEFSRPRNRLLRAGNDFYCRHIMPLTATLIARDRSGAYRYLPRSIETFLQGEAMCTAIRDAGFTDVAQTPLTFGVCSVYRGVV